MAFVRKKFISPTSKNHNDVDYKDIRRLRTYIMESGRMIPARMTGANAYEQRQITKMIKMARFLALLPYTDQQIQ